MAENVDNSPEGRLYRVVFGKAVENFPEELVELRQQAIKEVLDSLQPRYRRTLELRLGLQGNPQLPLKLAAEKLGGELRGTPYSRERVRQIEAKGLRFLRHPSRSCVLEPFRPYEPQNVGKLIWGFDYPYYLNQQLDPANILVHHLGDLNLPSEQIKKLQQIDGLSYIMSTHSVLLHRLFRASLFQIPVPDISVVKNHTEQLQERLRS